MTSFNRDPVYLNKVNLALEDLVSKSAVAGKLLSDNFKDTKTQIRGLERIIVSTTRFSEIQNYIKNQAGRDTKKSEPWRKVADALLKQLDGIETKAAEIAGPDAAAILDAKLRLARGWGRQVVANYLFESIK
jgi:hypothetical protein